MKKTLNNNLDQWVDSLPKNSWCATSVSNIKFEEQKSKIVFVNRKDNECLKINVDGGIVSTAESFFRCDKLLVDKSKLLFCFVELKGGDIEHAIEQLESSLKDSRLNPKCSQEKKAFIVGKNHYPVSSPLIQNGMKRLKCLNAGLIVRNTPATYIL